MAKQQNADDNDDDGGGGGGGGSNSVMIVLHQIQFTTIEPTPADVMSSSIVAVNTHPLFS